MSAKAGAKPCADLALLLTQASHALTTELAAGLSDLGVSPRVHCVLSKAVGGELTQTRLAEMCDLDKTTMVVTIDELEDAGLVERHRCTDDRRAHIITVTAAGKRLLAQADGIVARVYEDVLTALPAGERKAFVKALSRLVADRLSAPVPCDTAMRRRASRGQQIVS